MKSKKIAAASAPPPSGAGANPYPAWKRARCVGCADGLWMSKFHSRHHMSLVPDEPLKQCTAPTEAEYIAELERKLDLVRTRDERIEFRLRSLRMILEQIRNESLPAGRGKCIWSKATTIAPYTARSMALHYCWISNARPS